MSRQIKLRAWHKAEKKMCTVEILREVGAFLVGAKKGEDTISDSGRTIICAPKEGRFCDMEEFELMQFTGLYDKKQVEIFEDDIVKCGYGTGKVIFHAGCFMVEWIDDKEANMELLFSRNGTHARKDEEQFEVIGNIYIELTSETSSQNNTDNQKQLLYAVFDTGGQGMKDNGLLGVYFSKDEVEKAVGTSWYSIVEFRSSELYGNGIEHQHQK